MARKVITSYVDDLDGSEADGTVTFALDGSSYEVDLSGKNRKALEEALEPYISAGRKVSGSTRRTSTSSKAGRTDLQAIREWAKENGHAVSERGRISASVIQAYEDSH